MVDSSFSASETRREPLAEAKDSLATFVESLWDPPPAFHRAEDFARDFLSRSLITPSLSGQGQPVRVFLHPDKTPPK
jgi:hypothetical protein